MAIELHRTDKFDRNRNRIHSSFLLSKYGGSKGQGSSHIKLSVGEVLDLQDELKRLLAEMYAIDRRVD